jgi:hypothetical protein
MYLWMLRFGNIVCLTVGLLDVAKFTSLTPLKLLISCKLLLAIISLEMSSLPLWHLNLITKLPYGH